MSRILPQPWVTGALWVTWLLLNNSASPGHLVLATVLALSLPLFTQRFWPEYPRTIRVRPLLRLVAIVLYDIVVANLKLIPLILGPKSRLRPMFVPIPLDLTQPFPITLLASIITLTPGTVSANLSGDRRTLLVHDINVEDARAAAAHIKARYERPLLEIFE